MCVCVCVPWPFWVVQHLKTLLASTFAFAHFCTFAGWAKVMQSFLFTSSWQVKKTVLLPGKLWTLFLGGGCDLFMFAFNFIPDIVCILFVWAFDYDVFFFFFNILLNAKSCGWAAVVLARWRVSCLLSALHLPAIELHFWGCFARQCCAPIQRFGIPFAEFIWELKLRALSLFTALCICGLALSQSLFSSGLSCSGFRPSVVALHLGLAFVLLWHRLKGLINLLRAVTETGKFQLVQKTIEFMNSSLQRIHKVSF